MAACTLREVFDQMDSNFGALSRAGDIKIPGVEHVTMCDEAADDLRSIIDVASKSKSAENQDAIEIAVQLRISVKDKELLRVYPFLRNGQMQTIRVQTADGFLTLGEAMDTDEARTNKEIFGSGKT